MRRVVVLDGVSTEVDIDLATRTLLVGGRRLPVRVVAEAAGRVELALGSETVVVEGWPAGVVAPPATIVVNGERFALALGPEEAGTAPTVPAPGAPPAVPAAPAAGTDGPGVAVRPPMPGRVVEVRVADGARVKEGDVLLVLEAMKMRNEVGSPVAGTVAGLAVAPGQNVRARETLLRVVPDAP